jgi:hypothetical protein
MQYHDSKNDSWSISFQQCHIEFYLNYRFLNSYEILIVLCCVVYFRVQSTTKEVFVVDVMDPDATLANRRVFTRRSSHNAKITLM